MKPIVIYARVSTTDQDFQSQIDDLKVWCKNNNYKVVEVFGEQVSGYNLEAERLEYDKMKEYVIKKDIKDIAIWEISRLSRSMVKMVNEIDWFTKNKINLHFKKEGIESLSNNVTNKLLLTILGSMAQMERDTFIERSERGRISAVQKGKMICYSTYPYGYTTDDKGIIAIEETEAKVIKMIYDLAIKGTTLYGIAQHLNSLEVPTRLNLKGRTRTYLDGSKGTTKWTPVTVSKILKRTLYKGIRVYKDMTIPVPAIISEKDWDKVQQRFKDNVGYLNNTKHAYLFKSKIRCGLCKRMITTHIIRRKKSKDTLYYECEGYKKVNNRCPDKRISLSIELVDKSLYEVLFNHKYIKEIMAQESSVAIQKGDKLKQIDYYNSEIKSLESKGKRLKKLYVDGYSSDEEFSKEMNSLTNSITSIRNKISLLENEIQAINKIDIDEIIETYKGSEVYEMKREFVNKYVNSIFMYKPDGANVKWDKALHANEKIIYFEIFAFNFNVPLKVLITPFSKNVMASKDFQYLEDYNIVTDTSFKQ